MLIICIDYFLHFFKWLEFNFIKIFVSFIRGLHDRRKRCYQKCKLGSVKVEISVRVLYNRLDFRTLMLDQVVILVVSHVWDPFPNQDDNQKGTKKPSNNICISVFQKEKKV